MWLSSWSLHRLVEVLVSFVAIVDKTHQLSREGHDDDGLPIPLWRRRRTGVLWR
jgi:hypothetical protein